jgi:hypothetical protein
MDRSGNSFEKSATGWKRDMDNKLEDIENNIIISNCKNRR